MTDQLVHPLTDGAVHLSTKIVDSSPPNLAHPVQNLIRSIDDLYVCLSHLLLKNMSTQIVFGRAFDR